MMKKEDKHDYRVSMNFSSSTHNPRACLDLLIMKKVRLHTNVQLLKVMKG